MKRKAPGSKESPIKKPRPKEPDYCDVEPRRDDAGEILWPATKEAILNAQRFIKECAENGHKTLIVPDKDADGLSAGVIVWRTLLALGLPSSSLEVHLIQKGNTIHTESERLAMQEKNPNRIIVLDQGSISAPRIVPDTNVESLVIDHHLSDNFPDDAQVISACHYPPVATTSLMTYELCKDLHPSIPDSCGYLCCIGTHGDLGNTLKWDPPFPDMKHVLKTHTKKGINDAVSLVNAPRRTSKFDTVSAWTALLDSAGPKDLLNSQRLLAARAEINMEVELNTHAAPKFSKDGKIAVLRINSAAQVHPVIATRWAGFLQSKALEIVMVANFGYLPDLVNFSCRIARCARGRDPPVNIIESLKAAADLSTDGLVERLGSSFARGHKEASGGIVPAGPFEEMLALLKVGEKPDKPAEGEAAVVPKTSKKVVEASPQKNKIVNYFQKG